MFDEEDTMDTVTGEKICDGWVPAGTEADHAFSTLSSMSSTESLEAMDPHEWKELNRYSSSLHISAIAPWEAVGLARVKYVLRDAVKEVDATKPERLLDAVARLMAVVSSGATRAWIDAARTPGAIMESLADVRAWELMIETTEVDVAIILLQGVGKFRWRGEWEGECRDWHSPHLEVYIRPSSNTLLCDGNAGVDSYGGTSMPIRAKLEHSMAPQIPPPGDRISAQLSFIHVQQS
jgi:hypothetical protein